MNQDYMCTNHEGEPISGFCLDCKCNKTQWCVLCLNTNHNAHKDQCKTFNQIHALIRKFSTIMTNWQSKIKTEFEKVQKEYFLISKYLQTEIQKMIELEKTNRQYFKEELVNLKKWHILSDTQISNNNLISMYLLLLDMISDLQLIAFNIEELLKFKPQYVQPIHIVVYWDEKIQEFTTNQNMKLYSTIRNFLNLQDIVIYFNDKLCSELDTIADIQHLAAPNKLELIFNVKKISEVLKVEIKELKVVIEKQKNEIYNHNQEINRLKIFETNENQLNNQINELKKQVETLQLELKNLKQIQLPLVRRDFTQNNIDDQRKISAQEYIYQLIKKKSQELESLEIIHSSLLGSNFNFQSLVIQQKSVCHFCKLKILEDSILLKCSHSFHDRCFDLLLQGQIIAGNPFFTCICSIKLKPKEIFCLSNKYAAEIYKLQMLQSQLQKIKQSNLAFLQCQQNNCSFFYLYNQKLPQRGSFCPQCE